MFRYVVAAFLANVERDAAPPFSTTPIPDIRVVVDVRPFAFATFGSPKADLNSSVSPTRSDLPVRSWLPPSYRACLLRRDTFRRIFPPLSVTVNKARAS